MKKVMLSGQILSESEMKKISGGADDVLCDHFAAVCNAKCVELCKEGQCRPRYGECHCNTTDTSWSEN